MGLPEKAAVVESLLSSCSAASSEQAPKSVPSRQYQQSGQDQDLATLATLQKRIDSIEVWAHALDSDRANDNETVHSAARAHELMEAMAQQIVAEHRSEWDDQLASRVIVLEKK
eukprot:89469-Amphidinium_carterae.1